MTSMQVTIFGKYHGNLENKAPEVQTYIHRGDPVVSQEKRSIIANRCYGHLGGRLGALLLEQMLELGWLNLVEGKRIGFELTEAGYRGLQEWGIDVGRLTPSK